jgi:ATP-dependent helicase HrpB
MTREPLPVDDVLADVDAALGKHRACVLTAPTGSGKTTRVPPRLASRLQGEVWLLQPRRFAARAAARRIAEEAGERLGDRVGYRVRFDDRTGPRTRLIAATYGILLRRLCTDPFLEGVSAIVFDELHERTLEMDLCLSLAVQARRAGRDDLELIAMSATLAAEPVAAFLGEREPAPIVRAEGRLHPVEVEYLAPQGREAIEARVLRALEHLGTPGEVAGRPGDTLVFLPGVGEIRRCAEALEGRARSRGAELVQLYGDLDPAAQDAVFRESPRPRWILSTNIAESSVTLPRVSAVIDSGEVRRLQFDAQRALERLELETVSMASAVQRSGRAGRVAPGRCVRLWSPHAERGFAADEVPEVQRLDLSGAVLQLIGSGEAEPGAFAWFEAPQTQRVERALDQLEALAAIRSTPGGWQLTPLGERLERLPLSPRVGRLLLAGVDRGAPERAALAAALLSERDPFARSARDGGDAADSDLLLRIEALERGGSHRGLSASSGALRSVERAAKQLLRLVDRGSRRASESDEALLRAVFDAYRDRLAVRREPGAARGRLWGGAGVELSRSSRVTEAPLFCCLVADGGGAGADARVHWASGVDPAWLDEDLWVDEVCARWDAQRERAVGVRRRRWGRLAFEERDAPARPEQLEALLLERALEQPERALPLGDPAVAGFLARVGFMAEHDPDGGWPRFGRETWAELLPGLVVGARSFADLRKRPLLDHLRGALDHRSLSRLDREAPERLRVPSGSHLAVTYEAGRPPVLAARIQELFGWREAPRLAGGRVAILLHLLAPNHRPQQVTDDLASFWDNTYPQVRKDLRARYPKHAWPEDPWNAQAEKRPRRTR